jgi:hypothetical protein
MAGWLLMAGMGSGHAAPPEDAVVRALSGRDPVSCDAIALLTDTPRESLEAVVDTVRAPPWAPMRAAQCLIEGFPVESQARLEVWVTDPALKGLGRLVLSNLDRLPAAVGVAVARKALVGSDVALATERVAGSLVPEIRSLVKP